MRFVTDARNAVLDTAKELLRKGLVEGTVGNVSARMEDGNVCITRLRSTTARWSSRTCT